MIRTAVILLLYLCTTSIYAQNVRHVDSLKKALSQSQEDTNKVNLYIDLCWEYQWSFPDTALIYALSGLQLSKKINFEKGEALILNSMGEALSQKGNYPKALETEFKALELSEKINDSITIGRSITFIGSVFFYSGNYQKALFYYTKEKLYNASFKFPKELVYGHLGETYFHLNKMDSAFFYSERAHELCLKNNFLWPVPAFYLGAIYTQKGEYPPALQYYKKGISVSTNQVDFIDGYIGMSAAFVKMNLLDSAKGFKPCNENKFLAKEKKDTVKEYINKLYLLVRNSREYNKHLAVIKEEAAMFMGVIRDEYHLENE